MSEDQFKTILPLITLILGFLLSEGVRRYERRRKLRAYWAAIRAEMTVCQSDAVAILTHNVMAPLYRLPVTAVQTAFPILLAEGSLMEEEVLALTLYAHHVQDLNRGLDNAADCHARGNHEGLEQEYQRNRLKAEALLEKDVNKNVLEEARSIVDGKLLRWWEFL